jgi:bis(5'-nucleosyl)-tetraphosphatase (symmetrical)
MYGSAPAVWSPNLTEQELFRFGINSLTRMRMLDGASLDFKFKGVLASAPKNLKPWFDFEVERIKRIIFGHWSALGLIADSKIIALDTGCVWGGQLTAIRLDDDALFQIPAFAVCDLLSD